MKNEPLVAVVTPFYNTDKFLGDCIESVLRQTYSNWRYILLDNCSTDGSGAIARRYAEQDDRILLIEADEFVDQIPNFNRALDFIPADAEYVKIVLADDLLMQRALEEMVALGERHPEVLVVSGYSKVANQVLRDGLPIDTSVLDGRDVVRRYLYDDVLLFGSPTSVLVRAEAVRQRKPFYRVGINYPDTDAIFALLEHGRLGFVHQLVTFVRMHEGAFTPEIKRYRPGVLSGYATACDHASRFLPPDEARSVTRRLRWEYYADLAEGAWSFPGTKFWSFHRGALAGIGQRIDYGLLATHMVMVAFRELLRSPYTAGRAFARLLRRIMSGRRAHPADIRREAVTRAESPSDAAARPPAAG